MLPRKPLALLGALTVALPGMAFAAQPVTETVVEGHTVFVAVEETSLVEFAAVAGIAAKRTVIGGVLWFNNQELVSSTTASDQAAGAFVIASPAGQDPPGQHMDAMYAESYEFVDPNGVTWVVDRYTYEECYAGEGADEVEVPCVENGEGEVSNLQPDIDGDGRPDDLTGVSHDANGDGQADVSFDPNDERVRVETFDMYVVEIGARIADAATTCGPASGQDYNFVMLVRLDRFAVKSPDAYTDPRTNTTHDTASLDLWFSEDRPLEPVQRTMMWQPSASAGRCA